MNKNLLSFLIVCNFLQAMDQEQHLSSCEERNIFAQPVICGFWQNFSAEYMEVFDSLTKTTDFFSEQTKEQLVLRDTTQSTFTASLSSPQSVPALKTPSPLRTLHDALLKQNQSSPLSDSFMSSSSETGDLNDYANNEGGRPLVSRLCGFFPWLLGRQ